MLLEEPELLELELLGALLAAGVAGLLALLAAVADEAWFVEVW